MIMEKLQFIERTAEYEIIADLADDRKPLGENEGRIGLFQEVKDMKKEPIIVSEYESNHKPVRLPC